MRNLILFIVVLSTLVVSCEQSKNSYEIGISDVLHRRTFFRSENCNSDFYYNIIIRNDTLFVDGKLGNKRENYTRLLTNNESKYLYNLIRKVNPKNRTEKEINPTTGMTALIIKESGSGIKRTWIYLTILEI